MATAEEGATAAGAETVEGREMDIAPVAAVS
jgi:hypothetical protein